MDNPADPKEPDYNRYAKTIVEHAIDNITALLELNRYAKDIIAGWRHGYSTAAVARYILRQAVDADSLTWCGFNGYQQRAIELLRSALNVSQTGWGYGYDYVPSLDELQTPAPVVQGDINKRLAEIRKLINTDSENRFALEPRRLFNEPIDNAGIIKYEVEVPVVTAFTEEVFTEVRKLIEPVFVETNDD